MTPGTLHYSNIHSKTRTYNQFFILFSPETVDLASLLHVRQSLAKVLEIPTNNCTPKAAHRQTQQRKTLRKSAIDDKLNQHIGVQNSVFNLHDIDYKLSKLGQIYLVLEHLLLIESTLNMGKCENINNYIFIHAHLFLYHHECFTF